jgi:hypothetical protein
VLSSSSPLFILRGFIGIMRDVEDTKLLSILFKTSHNAVGNAILLKEMLSV